MLICVKNKKQTLRTSFGVMFAPNYRSVAICEQTHEIHIYIYIYIYIHTYIKTNIYIYIFNSITMKINMDASSAAQGGGGSFKNRKPIGEIGCCESRMAERIH